MLLPNLFGPIYVNRQEYQQDQTKFIYIALSDGKTPLKNEFLSILVSFWYYKIYNVHITKFDIISNLKIQVLYKKQK